MPAYTARIETMPGEVALTATEFHAAVAEAKAIGVTKPGARTVTVTEEDGGVQVTMPINRLRSAGERETGIERR